MSHHPPPPLGHLAVRFARHGATAANLAGLRCGGDLDLPLSEVGREQARQLGQRLAHEAPRHSANAVGLIVTSDLQRTRETAALIADALGGVPVVVLPAWGERRLGDWNLRTVFETQTAMLAGETPPGGEPDDDFIQRISGAAQDLASLLVWRPLLVGSRGVARALGQLCHQPGRLALGNGALCTFDLTALLRRETEWETS